jgi:type VI secretion system secreted protein Hcp
MAFDCFVKIDGIKGESTDGKIVALSYSWGASQPISAPRATGGRTGGHVDIQDFSFVKVLDKSTPTLFLACCDGRYLKEVVVELFLANSDKHPYMKYTMEDVIISSVRPGGSAQGSEIKPLESVTLDFGKVRLEYTPIDSSGKVGSPERTGWDLTNNKKL